MTYRRMSIQEATDTVLKENNLSKYRLAKLLKVQPIMVSHYLEGKVGSASARIAKVFYELFNILLDNYNNPKELEYDSI